MGQQVVYQCVLANILVSHSLAGGALQGRQLASVDQPVNEHRKCMWKPEGKVKLWQLGNIVCYK